MQATHNLLNLYAALLLATLSGLQLLKHLQQQKKYIYKNSTAPPPMVAEKVKKGKHKGRKRHPSPSPKAYSLKPLQNTRMVRVVQILGGNSSQRAGAATKRVPFLLN